ncbi:MAG: hypothetical protein WB809_02640 [Thermoplasmata archaeon]
MPLERVTYRFTVRLPVSADRAYRWATDYRADDLALMGFRARRKVQVLAKGSVLLTDSFDADPFGVVPGARVVKDKLVHFFPEQRSWTSTHVSGPTLHSQFLYQIVPLGRNSSRLHYIGVQIDHVKRAYSATTLAKRARELRQIDSRSWRRLARAMGEDYR